MAISQNVKRLLWSSSAAHCQNPACNRSLYVIFKDGNVASCEELAHIIPQSDDGPRGDEPSKHSQRDEYDNIIVLCPACHTLVDKAPDQFPAELLRKWKAGHESRVRAVFSVPTYKTRVDLSHAVHSLLRANRAIYEEYGPCSAHSADLLSDASREWNRRALDSILPNNRTISALLKLNDNLLRDDERVIAEKFALHQEAFEYNHVSGNKSAVAPLFPTEMNNLLME